MKITAHIPVEPFGYIQLDWDEKTDMDIVIQEYNNVLQKFKEFRKPKSESPKFIGDRMVEHGHTYLACMNEKSKELYWEIERV